MSSSSAHEPRVLFLAALLAAPLSGCTWGGGSVGNSDYKFVCSGLGGRVIDGDLDLSFADPDDVAALSCVREVTGQVTLSRSAALSDLRGLESLREIGGALTIVDASALTSLAGLDGLRAAGSVTVSGAPLLVDLSGLDALEQTDALTLDHDDALQNLEGLRALSAGVGSAAVAVTIQLNAALVDLTGLGALEAVSDLELSDNPSLTSARGLASLRTVKGGLTLSGNAALADLTALRGVKAVGAPGLEITANDSLGSVAGLEDLATVHGDLVIASNSALASLDGLSGLSLVEGAVWVDDNACLPQSEVSELVEQLDQYEVQGSQVQRGNSGPCEGL